MPNPGDSASIDPRHTALVLSRGRWPGSYSVSPTPAPAPAPAPSPTPAPAPAPAPATSINEDAAVIWFDPSIPFSQWNTPKRQTRLQLSGWSSDTYGVDNPALQDANGNVKGSDGVARLIRVDQGNGRYALRMRTYRGEAPAFGATYRVHMRAVHANQLTWHNTPYVAVWAIKPWILQTFMSAGGWTRSYYGLSGGQDGDAADNSPAVVRHSTNNVAAIHLRTNNQIPHVGTNNSYFNPNGDWYDSFAAAYAPRYFVAEYKPGWAPDCYLKLYTSVNQGAYTNVLNFGPNGYRATNPANDYEFNSYGFYLWNDGFPDDYIWGSGTPNGTLQQYDASGFFLFKQSLLPSGWTIQDMFNFIFNRFA